MSFLDRPLARYGIALCATGAAFAGRMLLAGMFGSSAAFITFYPAVMLSATLGGFWAGILATALAVPLTAIWILHPVGVYEPLHTADMVSLAVFLAMGVFMSSVAEMYHRARQKGAAYEASIALEEAEQRVRRKLDSIMTADGGIGDLELVDVLDIPAIQSMMDSFHKLSPIPMAIVDLQGEVLVGVGWQDICTKFHRAHPEACKHCVESDTQLTTGLPPGEFRLYKCKNSMWDVATPIIVGGRRVGNLFSGQFFLDDEPLDYELFRKQARLYGFDESDYIAALDRVPRLSRESLNEGMVFFMRLADLLSKLGYGNVKLARSLAQQEALTASLRESERKATAILNAATESILMLGRDGRILAANETAARRLGMGAAEIVAKCLGDLVPPELAESRMARIEEVVRTGRPVRFEDERAGMIFDHSFYPIADADGNTTGVAVFSHDITDAKQAQAALLDTNKRLDLISDTASRLLLTDDPQGLVQSLCERVMEVLDCQAFFNFLVDEEAGRLHLNAFAGIPDDAAMGMKWLDLGVAVCGCAARDGCRIVAEDIMNTPDPRTDLVKSFGIQAYACNPLLGQGGRVIGTLSFGSRTRTSFTEDELDLMKTVADQVATAVERMRLLDEARQRARALAESAERISRLDAHMREFYRRTILAATEGKLVMSDVDEIESIAGTRLGAWEVTCISDVAKARDDVTSLAREAGMEESRIYDLVGCVVESAANAAKHAGGGLASLHRRDDALLFVVSDSGPGIGAMRLPDVALTKGYTTAGTLGMGYKVMINVADKVYLATGPDGTTVASELKLHGKVEDPTVSRTKAWSI